VADRWNRSSGVGTWPARCDVVVTNLTSPRQKRFGLRYEDISPSNPRVIYLALNGYGVEGPERDRLGFDYAAFWSRSGIMGSLGEPDSPPIQQRPGMGDQTTSLTLAAAIGFALYERERSGKGQRIDCSLLHTALWVLGPDIAAALQTGAPVRRLSRSQTKNPIFNFYQASDGRWIQLVMIESEKFWPQFCRATGLEELILDTRFDSHLHRIKHCEELIGILDERFATKTAEEWGSRLDASGCIWAPVQTLDQVVVDPQVQANDYLVSLHDETNGSIQVVSAPIRFQQTPGQVRKPAPELGQDTEMALLELGYSWEKVAIMKDEGAIIS
jgi:crotonobetainyl-CoA:carnitine CoA-transferase CaiB-like acyl-CoA transferase